MATGRSMPRYQEWQAHVEPITFKRIYLNPLRLAQAIGYVTPLRQTYVRFIHFETPLSIVQQPVAVGRGFWVSWSEAMQVEQVEHNSTVFSSHLANLLYYLNGWTLPHENVELSLGISGTSCGLDWPVSLRVGFYRHLPKIDFIKKFRHTQGGVNEWKLTPTTCCMIASLFPSLRSINWCLEEEPPRNYITRAEVRNTFAAALVWVPSSVRSFTLAYYYCWMRAFGDFSVDPQSRAPDLLSIALRQLSKRLEKVVLSMDIGHEFFIGNDSSAEETDWLRMREVTVIAGSRTPQEDALFNFDDETQSAIPIPGMVNPYYLAAGRAAAGMPNLSFLTIHWALCFNTALFYVVRKDTLGARLFVTGT
ncbi:uncharacterized protein PG986_010770 [Apiospora aurea]|uniref:Uncharacterized protein n=1 Tax=Apiospora aurea TaxID=335848 RepID=A0ABR1Q3X2_9PEZI